MFVIQGTKRRFYIYQILFVLSQLYDLWEDDKILLGCVFLYTHHCLCFVFQTYNHLSFVAGLLLMLHFSLSTQWVQLQLSESQTKARMETQQSYFEGRNNLF